MIKPVEKYILVGDMQRVGMSKFLVRLEHEHFNPSTDLNDLLELEMRKWPEDWGLIWFVIKMPSEYKEVALGLLEECGLRAADGIPNIISADKAESFPVSGDNVFTIEYVQDNPAYKANYETLQKMKQDESLVVEKILSQQKQKYIDELRSNHSEEEIQKIIDEDQRKAEAHFKEIKEKLA